MPTQAVPGHDRATPGSLQSFGENRLRWNGGSLSRHGRPPRPRRCHQILQASLATDSDRLRRFEQEARAAAALNHPNIVAVCDVGMHEGSPYIVSELLEGHTLRAP